MVVEKVGLQVLTTLEPLKLHSVLQLTEVQDQLRNIIIHTDNNIQTSLNLVNKQTEEVGLEEMVVLEELLWE